MPTIDDVIEEDFVKTYIVPGRRERLLFELRGKRREKALDRFCHGTGELLIRDTIVTSGQDIRQQLQDRIDMVKEKGCYILSVYDDLDGTYLDKDRVLDTILGRGMPTIAVFKDFAIIETEQEQGPAVKYLLQRL